MSTAALIFSVTVLLRRLFGWGALLSSAIIFSATVLVWRLHCCDVYIWNISLSFALGAFQRIKVVFIDGLFDKKTTNNKKETAGYDLIFPRRLTAEFLAWAIPRTLFRL